ncbi:uncharacterized protein LOC126278413 [Schistocerca gregaria]|uniref:uncharacterized protein LOC126278413 n=1 Tax=Schistocerca gregaria TaxID=7010 RepID=UPI00211EDA67|nr:uncharacterized protein LOC126278413 [Schistocerca gregaria]XP_049834478.1 uncharacterized protein LOC126278413 [Schistocerca gregaria]XP_049834479.1 uncharacterized protein LOC126278413 [Schistocerca gregaria]
MLVYLIILSVTAISRNYAADEVQQESHVRTERDETHANKYPFLAYVNIGNNSCAGAVLSDSWVITARACGNTTAQEPGWVYAGGRNVQKRSIAQQHSCPDDHHLLLLQLGQPFTFDDGVSALPIVRPGTFSDDEGSCEVITFGTKPSETGLNTAHAVETRLASGSECKDTASDISAVVQSRSEAAPSLDPAHNGTIVKGAATASDQPLSNANADSAKISGDAGKKTRDTHSLEVMSPEMVDADLLCSSEITEEPVNLKHLGSPVVCQGVLIALVTPNPSDGTSREKKEESKTYYTAIGPDYSWITEKIPGVQVVPWNEAAKAVGSSTSGTRLHKYKMHLGNARRRRLSQLANMIAGIAPGKESSEASKLELGDELEPDLGLNKIFSVWFPLARRVRGIIFLNRMYVRPQSELYGDLSEKAEAALRPLRRVKRSNPEQAADGSTDEEGASAPLLQSWRFRRAQRGDRAPQQQCPEAADGQRRRAADGDTSVHAPCVVEAKTPRATTRLAQRLAVRDKSTGTPGWRERNRYSANAA